MPLFDMDSVSKLLKEGEPHESSISSSAALVKVSGPKVDLPREIQLAIIKKAVLDGPQPCIAFHLRGNCFDPWSCPFSHTGMAAGYVNRVTPDVAIASVSPLFRDETHKVFFRHNVFVFTIPGGDCSFRWKTLSEVENVDWPWQDFRDPRATRLIDFIDRPDWKNQGSRFFVNDSSFDHVDTYRYSIRHLILGISYESCIDFNRDWDWVMKVDWSTLPDLETIYLDLRQYSGSRYCTQPVESPEIQHEKLEAGAKRMQGLGLKKLVLAGLCSFRHFHDSAHRLKMKALFQPAMCATGTPEFLDREIYVRW